MPAPGRNRWKVGKFAFAWANGAFKTMLCLFSGKEGTTRRTTLDVQEMSSLRPLGEPGVLAFALDAIVCRRVADLYFGPFSIHKFSKVFSFSFLLFLLLQDTSDCLSRLQDVQRLLLKKPVHEKVEIFKNPDLLRFLSSTTSSRKCGLWWEHLARSTIEVQSKQRALSCFTNLYFCCSVKFPCYQMFPSRFQMPSWLA